ncbi:hypothetical protein F4804DRAFT_110971 [Jackrogersella minutella]|nr:hypothetical protein F4804DRAFT_110971 [Jackrogersella minutella]
MDRRARFACIACRRLKRKCPKELPSCSLCLRLDKRCEYPLRVRNAYDFTNHEPSDSPQGSIGEANLQPSDSPVTALDLNLEQGVISANKGVYAFPAMFFLDSEVCIKPLSSDCNQIINPTVPPCSLSPETLGVYEKYFYTIHQWLPILSKKYVRRHLTEYGSAADSPFQLLFLCMKLVAESLPQGASARANQDYTRILETLLRVETSCLPCLQLLQSVILISVYEISHAIYPAAYMRVGYASRLCIMMGFHDRKNASQLFKDTVTWTAREEERRAWWAVFCLDRITNQGIEGPPLSTPEPSPGELLPCPEVSWNEGRVGFNEPLFAASFSNNTSLGSFANVCQAAHVLGRVLCHRDSLHSGNVTISFRISEAKQLHHILASLSSHLNVISQEPLSLRGSVSVSLALCYSARLILYDIYACNEKYSSDHGRSSEEAEMQREAMTGIFEVVETIWQFARQLLDSLHLEDEGETNNISPLLCHCLYAAAGESEWLILEQENSSAETWLRDIVNLLQVIATRWQVAGVYLSAIYKWPGYNSLAKS